MKGVILVCLKELVTKNFGKDKWEDSLEKAGMKRDTVFLAISDISDGVALKLIDSVRKVLGITLFQAADAFGEYWVCSFAPKIYAPYYKGVNSAREFLLNMDKVHQNQTINISNARPPRFEYEWKDDKTLVMKYKSHRGLIDILVGLIKGVGKYFREDIKVTKLGDDKVEIVFVK